MHDHVSIFQIDDNRGDLTLAHEAFLSHRHVSHEGSEEPIAAIGKVAKDTLAGHAPSLIVLDLNLPGFDGMDILRLLAANRQTQKIPVVIFTSSMSDQERETCLQLGARAFITKPDAFDELCRAIASMLALVRTSTSASASG